MVERRHCPNAGPDCALKPMAALVAGLDEQGMEAALQESGACVEAEGSRLLSGPNLQYALDAGGLYMALSTATAYSLAPARLFCRVLAQRLDMSAGRCEGIELSLHEAIMNGLLHGNLEMSSDDRQTWAGFRRFCEQIDGRLLDPAFAGRPIEIMAVADGRRVAVTVVDSGPGYCMTPTVQETDPGRKSGRGLAVISHFAREIEITEGGRRLSMRFER